MALPEAVSGPGHAFLDLYGALVTGPFVLGHLGQSLDGRIATETGHSHYVTGEENIIHLHRLRALADAVVVGAGTVASDDPALTVRHVPGVNPVRVVIDPTGRLESVHKIFTDSDAPTLVLTRVAEGPGERIVLPPAVTSDGGQGLDPKAILAVLKERGLDRVFIEGGGITVSTFLQAGLLDRLQIVVAPMLIGSGIPAINLPTIQKLDEALRPPCRIARMGSDVLFDFDLRN
ncbi:MAG: RibD family protein [Alphaproteobacteria bacterium]|nr:RibD family protein [Alphaproteobacteria bacterium]MBU0799012.1 RibD family protein [Alphaproteobacteria bacterium]MBU0889242.1 RibD family protein [Alphaproteobacteria bacterium]MBU1815058.1 RibD family protein [Alphaproteobacteria bacterium]